MLGAGLLLFHGVDKLFHAPTGSWAAELWVFYITGPIIVALLGPANIMDLHPMLDLHITSGVILSLGWDVFWRQSPHDGIYSPPGKLVRPSGGSEAGYVGNQLEAQIAWQIDRHLSVTANYIHFFPGPFITQTGPAQDIDFVAAWVAYKF